MNKYNFLLILLYSATKNIVTEQIKPLQAKESRPPIRERTFTSAVIDRLISSLYYMFKDETVKFLIY